MELSRREKAKLSQDWETRYKSQPDLFAREVLKIKHLTAQQLDMMRDVVDALEGRGPRTICWPAGHGIGKSVTLAIITIWICFCFKRALALSTAPTWTQVEGVLWREIRWLWGQADLPGECLKTSFEVDKTDSQAYGRSTNEPQRFQGPHAPILLGCLDECPAILPGIIEVLLKGITVNENYIVLAPGNPVEPTGPYRDLCKNARTKVRHLSCLDHPNVINQRDVIPGAVSYRACLELVEDYCEEIDEPKEIDALEDLRLRMLEGLTPNGKPYNKWAHAVEDPLGNLQALYWNPPGWDGPIWLKPSAIVQSRMLGRFPDEGDNILIPIRWVEDAMKRGTDVLDRLAKLQAGRLTPDAVPEWKAENPCVVAMDVARRGDNATVIMARRGRVVLPAEEYTQQNLNVTAQRFIESYRRHGAGFGCIDIGAFGWGVHDDIVKYRENEDIAVFPIDFGGVPGVKLAHVQFANKKAQMYWGLRCLLEKGKIDLPWDEVLRDQLCSIRYEHNDRGQLQIESKRAMRKRRVASPDRADTLAMLCDEAIEGAWVDDTPDAPDWFVGAYERNDFELAGRSQPNETWAEGARCGVWD